MCVGSLNLYGVPECFSVSPSRPQLEDVNFIIANEFLIIDNKLGQTPRYPFEVWKLGLLANLLYGVQKELEGRHSLLTIDDLALVDVLGRCRHLLQHDSTKEVWTGPLLCLDFVVA